MIYCAISQGKWTFLLVSYKTFFKLMAIDELHKREYKPYYPYASQLSYSIEHDKIISHENINTIIFQTTDIKLFKQFLTDYNGVTNL